MTNPRTRRRLVSTLGTAAATALAGCFTVTESELTGTSGTPPPTDTAQSPTTEATQPESGPSVPASVDAHLAETSNYDGTIVDARGRATVTVVVGVEANSGRFGFAPPAVHVDPDTTVQWEWTGDGGGHIVKSAGDGPLDSGDAVAEPGVNYEFTFEDEGIYNYVCIPHRSLGMKGSVVVGSDYPTAESSTR